MLARAESERRSEVANGSMQSTGKSMPDILSESQIEKKQLQEEVSQIEDELKETKSHLTTCDAKRREALKKFLDLKGNIRVFCRMRPLFGNEKGALGGSIVASTEKISIKTGGKSKPFYFDKVFLSDASQDDIFKEAEPILRSAMDGHNICVFAYGQTGSGKTYTMEGRPESLGLVPRAIQELFRLSASDKTAHFTFTISMLEVYKGHIRDLLVPRQSKLSELSQKYLSIQMDSHGGVEIENLREVVVRDFKEANQWHRKGSRARSTAWTNVNELSSRSHCLTRIAISSSTGGICTNISKVWMIDLGGSERLLKTQAHGQTMDEGKAINLSLSALGDVISALQKKQAHIPYRNNKLTHILMDSLGKDSKVVMFIHVSPNVEDLAESVCSLGFASRARGINLGKELPEEAKEQRAQKMADAMLDIKQLEEECLRARNKIDYLETILDEKKTVLNRNHSPEIQGTSETCTSQEEGVVDMESSKASNGLDGCMDFHLPRFMTPTACSLLRSRTRDLTWTSPRKDLKMKNRCDSPVATVPKQHSNPNQAKDKHTTSGPSRKRMSPPKHTIDESECVSEMNTNSGTRADSTESKSSSFSKTNAETKLPLDSIKTIHTARQSALPNSKRVSGLTSKQPSASKTVLQSEASEANRVSHRSSVAPSAQRRLSFAKVHSEISMSDDLTMPKNRQMEPENTRNKKRNSRKSSTVLCLDTMKKRSKKESENKAVTHAAIANKHQEEKHQTATAMECDVQQEEQTQSYSVKS